ncbi:MAG: NADH-quinone oxidoreductase subunit A, partial [Pseudohongiellaceae bacterium]
MDLRVTDVIAQYWAIGFFIISVVMLCVLMLGLSSVLGGHSQGRSKSLPFESG